MAFNSLWFRLAAIFLLFWSSRIEAQFVKLNQFAFASADGRTALVVSKDPETPGVFIAHTETPMPVQAVSFENLASAKAKTVFLKFDLKQGRFISLVLGADHEYSIQGSFSLTLGTSRVALDTHLTGSYLTVVSETSPEPSIMGILGLEPIFNLKGEVTTALFEANQLQREEYKGVLENYQLIDGPALKIRDIVLTGSRVGVPTETSHPCLSKDEPILDESSAAKSTENGQQSAHATVDRENLVPLGMTSSALIAFDYSKVALLLIRTQKAADGQTKCVLAKSQLLQ